MSAERLCDHAPNAGGLHYQDDLLPGRAAAKIFTGDQDVPRLIDGGEIAPARLEEIRHTFRLVLSAGEAAARDDLVPVHIVAQHDRFPLHPKTSRSVINPHSAEQAATSGEAI